MHVARMLLKDEHMPLPQYQQFQVVRLKWALQADSSHGSLERGQHASLTPMNI